MPLHSNCSVSVVATVAVAWHPECETEAASLVPVGGSRAEKCNWVTAKKTQKLCPLAHSVEINGSD